MKKLALSAAEAALLLSSVAFAIAKDQAPGASGQSPGHEMQKHGSKKGSSRRVWICSRSRENKVTWARCEALCAIPLHC